MEIKNKDLDKNVVATIRPLKEGELDKLLELQEKVLEWLPLKELYSPSSKEELRRFVDEQGEIVSVWVEDDLIAIGAYCKLGLDSENYGYDIGKSGDELFKIAQIESTIVHKSYRGNKLQGIICEEIEKIARREGMEILMATVSPKNPYSLNTFLAKGFKIEKEKPKYGGLLRCILSKSLV